MFNGKYTYSLDAKGRVSIPAKLRRSVKPEANDTFMMTIGTEKCIVVYPMDEWNKYAEKKLAALDDTNQEDAWILRYMIPNTIDDKFDTQSRLLLAKHLIEYAELEKEVLIIGLINKMEIWNPDNYEAYIKSNNTPFSEVLEKSMSKKRNEKE